MGKPVYDALVNDDPQGSKPVLSEFHPLVTDQRDTGPTYHLISRLYPTGDVEKVAIRLDPDESMRRGKGGAARKNTDKAAMDEATLSRSVARSRTQVRRKCLMAGVDRMLTCTFRENVDDINRAWVCFAYFNKLMRWRYKERWRYVVVPEYQQRGAVHFHLAIAGFYDVKTVRKFWLRAVGKAQGNIDITSPRNAGKNSWNPKRIANYIGKYLSKTDSVEFNRRRYASGGKIQPPPVMRGWLALGVPVIQVVRQIIERMTHRPVTVVRESEGYFSLVYLST